MHGRTQFFLMTIAASVLASGIVAATALYVQKHGSSSKELRVHDLLLLDDNGNARVRVHSSSTGTLLLSAFDARARNSSSSEFQLSFDSSSGPRVTIVSPESAQVLELGNIPIGDTPNLKGSERLLGLHLEAFNSACPSTIDLGIFSVNGKAVRVMSPISGQLCQHLQK